MHNKKSVARFKKSLGIKDYIVSISFVNCGKLYCQRDTFCTAMARTFFRGTPSTISLKSGCQLCDGGNYFLGISGSDKDAIEVYVKKEKVFANNNVCRKYFRDLPKLPPKFKGKNIVMKEFDLADKSSVVLLLVNPAQVGRIVGLVNYGKYKKIEILPNQPTCISLFASVVSNSPHINFIDYFDRYYQGKVGGKNIWSEGKMIVSLTAGQFKVVLDNFDKSSQGSFIPDIDPRDVDPI